MFEAFAQFIGTPANLATLGIVLILAIERLITGGYVNIGKFSSRYTDVKKSDLDKSTNGEGEEIPPQWAQTLTEHFNHTTSARLENIEHKIQKIDKIDVLEQEIKNINQTLSEFDKYGIKVRNSKK